ncbi:MAG: hypothetical protein AAGB46_08455 [Verrucomicrobiota bacterium]
MSQTPNPISIYQDQLLEEAAAYFEEEEIPQKIVDAFRKAPRHRFVSRFLSNSEEGWIDVTESNLNLHLSSLYGNHPLCIHLDDKGVVDSTISQPSLVLLMLDLLDLREGLRVFELGAGSGWNAALMGALVGNSGEVTSYEIIEDLVVPAQRSADELGLSNVSIVSGNGIEAMKSEGPFDRGVFTAAADSLPDCFFDGIKEGGLLLLVIKINGDGDLLAVLRKTGDHFDSEYHFKCRFVPVTGVQLQDDKHIENLGCRRWVAHGQPDIEELDLRIHPSGKPVELDESNWTISHSSCILEWRIRGGHAK